MVSASISMAVGLQAQIMGRVYLPGESDYERLRRGWNLAIDQHPALILVPSNAEDVMAGIRFAREQGLGVAVQLTGHGVHQPADDSLLIITSRMTAIELDVEARTVKVEAGVVWQGVLDVVTPHGLAPLNGTSPHVGVVGYTLGGGIGWLARRYGFAADSVRWIEIVTADGVLRRASPTENVDLFWGLRGGGGNFGVVTALEFEVYPVATIYGGNLTYPAHLAGEALRFFRDWVTALPDELTASIAVMKFPSLPQVPEPMRGKMQVMLKAAFAGDVAQGEALLKPWLDWHTPTSNTFREMPFADIASISNDPVDPVTSYGSSEQFDQLSDEAIDMIVHHMTDAASPFLVNELRHAGGAITRVAADANAIGNREAVFYLQMGGLTPTPEVREGMKRYIRQYTKALQPFLRGGAYLNFMSGGEAQRRAKDAYLPASYQRLLDLKAKYDPNNQFHFSYQLITPEPAA